LTEISGGAGPDWKRRTGALWGVSHETYGKIWENTSSTVQIDSLGKFGFHFGSIRGVARGDASSRSGSLFSKT